MPVEMERALKKEAKKKGLTGDHANAYVYGTMRKAGWTPKREQHVHGGSMHEIVYTGEPVDIREVDMSKFGNDWEPRQFKDNVVGMEPFSHEQDAVKYGHVTNPGEIVVERD
jgi:hypothetical protein